MGTFCWFTGFFTLWNSICPWCCSDCDQLIIPRECVRSIKLYNNWNPPTFILLAAKKRRRLCGISQEPFDTLTGILLYYLTPALRLDKRLMDLFPHLSPDPLWKLNFNSIATLVDLWKFGKSFGGVAQLKSPPEIWKQPLQLFPPPRPASRRVRFFKLLPRTTTTNTGWRLIECWDSCRRGDLRNRNRNGNTGNFTKWKHETCFYSWEYFD